MLYWQIRQFSARFHWVSVKLTSQYKKEEYISNLVTHFQISNRFIFRDIYVCILSIRCFLCVLHVLLTDSSIFARFHWVSVEVTSKYKKEEYISSLETHFQISSRFIFRDIYVCILSIRCFLCVLHVLLTDSSIFARFHWVSVEVTSKYKKEEYISSLETHFQISSRFIFRDIYVFILSYDVFCVFCMFYWQIRQFSLGSIQFREELHLRKRKKNRFPV